MISSSRLLFSTWGWGFNPLRSIDWIYNGHKHCCSVSSVGLCVPTRSQRAIWAHCSILILSSIAKNRQTEGKRASRRLRWAPVCSGQRRLSTEAWGSASSLPSATLHWTPELVNWRVPLAQAWAPGQKLFFLFALAPPSPPPLMLLTFGQAPAVVFISIFTETFRLNFFWMQFPLDYRSLPTWSQALRLRLSPPVGNVLFLS